MPEFSLHDKRYLEAAQGWLGLGRWDEANEELENITPQYKAHPEVLALRFELYSRAGKWEYAAEIARSISELVPDNPFGTFHLAFSLYELKRTMQPSHVYIARIYEQL